MVTVFELESIRQKAEYARFVHTNLHMHTPATPWDWDPRNPGARASSITIEKYFEELNKTSLELVAITDHNCVDWCEPLIALAKAGRESGSSKLHILPGVEITTYEGPHLLAIFDEATPVEELRRMLIRLGMSGKGEHTDKVGCVTRQQLTIDQVFSMVVEELQGLVIAPHVHSNDGLFGAKSFRGKAKVLNSPRLRILATNSGEIKRVVESDGSVRFLYNRMDTLIYQNSYAFINISDCHRIEDFERDTTWIKMATPSLEGVRQIIYEPELRVAGRIVNTGSSYQHPEAFEFVTPTRVQYPHFIGLAVTGGMLDGQAVAFSPHQNCVIGKNYSGKSSLLDCLRFVLNAIPTDDAGRTKLVNRLRGIIGESGEVRLYLQDEHHVYGVSRVLSCSRAARSKDTWTLDGAPEIFRCVSGQFIQEDYDNAAAVLGLEVYPQGEVVKIKDNVSQQMRIVDSLAKVEQEIVALTSAGQHLRTSLYGELLTNGEAILALLAAIEKLDDTVAEIPSLRDEIARLEVLAASPRLDDLALWGDARGKVVKLRNTVEGIASEFSKLLEKQQGYLDLLGDISGAITANAVTLVDADQYGAVEKPDVKLTVAQTLDSATAIYRQTIDSIQSAYSAARAEALQGTIALQEVLANCDLQYNQVKQAIQEMLGAGSSENAQIVLLGRIEQKRERMRQLEEAQKKLKEAKGDLATQREQRARLLDQYRSAWKEISGKRRQIVDLINQDSSDNIQAELLEGAEIEEFQMLLESIADSLTSSTNRISNKQAQLLLIAKTLQPQRLIELIEAGDATQLCDAVPELRENTARILIGMGRADIHRLQLCVLRDRFVIKYRREGESEFTPLDGGLSGGEQALALLSVAMVRKPLPLVIDQPEDELGQALITKDLVESIRKAKAHRQLIFVTHVPNIPVLADSEQVIYMRQTRAGNNTHLCVDRTGSLDSSDIINCLLELDGGRVAIEKRYERYAPLLSRRPS